MICISFYALSLRLCNPFVLLSNYYTFFFLPGPRVIELAMTIRHPFGLFFLLFLLTRGKNKLSPGQFTLDPQYVLQILDPL